jgi:hypothetical protein
VRLLLDAHLSVARIARPLRARGHDVLALAEHRELDGMTDVQVLELAVEERRILVTRNAEDFAPILRIWAEAGRHHHGCVLLWSLRLDRFAAIVSGVAGQMATRPRPQDWLDLTVAI